MIHRLTSTDAINVAQIHLESLPNDFLPSFGINFLEILYKHLLASSNCIALGWSKKKQLVGFVIGAPNTNILLSETFKKSLWELFPSLLKRLLLSPKTVKYLFQTLLYGKNSKLDISAELLILAVSKNERRKRIGTKLINRLQIYFKQKQIFLFKIGTLANNQISNTFYKKKGAQFLNSFYLFDKKWNVYVFNLSRRQKQKLSIILPTYNESGNIVQLIKSIDEICKKNKVPYEIILVDDNSSDKTVTIAQKNFEKNHHIKIFTRIHEKGLASAILFGIKKATGYFILVMDTDFNHDPNEIPYLYISSLSSQLVIGSRFIKNGGMQNRKRYYLSLLFNCYIRILLRLPARDNLSGFFIMRRKDVLSLPPTIFYGFGDYFIRLIYLVNKKKGKIIEIPVYYKDRTAGVSKSKFLQMFISYTYSAYKLLLGKI